MLALHNECLTRRYLLGRLDFLLGLLGFSLGMLCALEGRGKLGLSRLRVKLQSLVLLHESLELLLHLAHPCLLLFLLGALLGRFVFGLGQRLLQGRHFTVAPGISMLILSFCNHIFLYTYRRGITYLCSLRAASC